MQQLGNKSAALYYRVANSQSLELHLDNQMQKLLCYTDRQGFDSFKLYADICKSGLTLDRPAFGALKADIEAGRIDRVIVYDIARISRDITLVWEFTRWAQSLGFAIVIINDNQLLTPVQSELSEAYRSFLKGGGRV